MLAASSDTMIRTGMLRTKAISVAVTRSLPGNTASAKNTPQASVAPTGAEKTALKMAASMADASRTRPVLCRTNSSWFGGPSLTSLIRPSLLARCPDRVYNKIEHRRQVDAVVERTTEGLKHVTGHVLMSSSVTESRSWP